MRIVRFVDVEGREVLGEENRHVLILRFNRARLLMRAGRFADALADLEELVGILEKVEPEGSTLRSSAVNARSTCRQRVD